jgi:hypothetical protein
MSLNLSEALMFGSNARKIKQLTEAVTLLLRIELQRQGVIASDGTVTLRGQAVVAQGSNDVRQ